MLQLDGKTKGGHIVITRLLLTAQGTLMQEEVVNRVEQAIDRNGVSQDREKCQDMLKKYASLGMIRQNGLCIRKYIYDKNGKGQGRIVYRMDELSPSDVDGLNSETGFVRHPSPKKTGLKTAVLR